MVGSQAWSHCVVLTQVELGPSIGGPACTYKLLNCCCTLDAQSDPKLQLVLSVIDHCVCFSPAGWSIEVRSGLASG